MSTSTPMCCDVSSQSQSQSQSICYEDGTLTNFNSALFSFSSLSHITPATPHPVTIGQSLEPGRLGPVKQCTVKVHSKVWQSDTTATADVPAVLKLCSYNTAKQQERSVDSFAREAAVLRLISEYQETSFMPPHPLTKVCCTPHNPADAGCLCALFRRDKFVLFGYGVYDNGVNYAAILEHCARGDVFNRLNEWERQPVPRDSQYCFHVTRKWFAQLLVALDFLHNTCKVVHSDVKLENLFLTENDDLRLGDFGLSRVMTQDAEASPALQVGWFAGTKCYATLESRLRQPYNPFAADVWAAGCCFLFLLTRRPDMFDKVNDIKYVLQNGIVSVLKHLKVDASVEKDLYDFLSHIFCYESQRWTVKQLMEHPFIKEEVNRVRCSRPIPLSTQMLMVPPVILKPKPIRYRKTIANGKIISIRNIHKRLLPYTQPFSFSFKALSHPLAAVTPVIADDPASFLIRQLRQLELDNQHSRSGFVSRVAERLHSTSRTQPLPPPPLPAPPCPPPIAEPPASPAAPFCSPPPPEPPKCTQTSPTIAIRKLADHMACRLYCKNWKSSDPVPPIVSSIMQPNGTELQTRAFCLWRGENDDARHFCFNQPCQYSWFCDEHAVKATQLEIKPSTITGAGMGLFAASAFKAGDVVCDYNGEYLDQDSYDCRYRPVDVAYYCFGYKCTSDQMQMNIDARGTQSSLGRWINDIRDPKKYNVKWTQYTLWVDTSNQYHQVLGVCVVALRDIAPGEELLIDYGDDYWSHPQTSKMIEQAKRCASCNTPLKRAVWGKGDTLVCPNCCDTCTNCDDVTPIDCMATCKGCKSSVCDDCAVHTEWDNMQYCPTCYGCFVSS